MQYKTKSIQISSYLCSCPDIKFVGAEYEDINNILFVFEPRDKVEKAVEKFYGGRARPNLLKVFKNYRFLKDMIFEKKRSHYGK